VSWDQQDRGPPGGYFSESVRLPDTPYPVKVYRGRGAAGQEAAADVDRRRQARRQDREAVRAEQEATAAIDTLSDELRSWAEVLAAAWLVLTGHHRHRGEWRLRHGSKT
jgi:nucleotide-binding universal stress UspA family protein